MKLTDYPTPKTDAAIALANDPDGAPEVCDLCESLERRLGVCQEALQITKESLKAKIRPDIIIQDITKTLFLTGIPYEDQSRNAAE